MYWHPSMDSVVTHVVGLRIDREAVVAGFKGQGILREKCNLQVYSPYTFRATREPRVVIFVSLPPYSCLLVIPYVCSSIPILLPAIVPYPQSQTSCFAPFM